MKTKKKHAGGRPLKYPDEQKLIDETNIYLSMCGREQTQLPTIEGLSIYLDLPDTEINEYEKRFKKFGTTIKKLKDMQKSQLMNDGMYGGKEVNSGMAIFLLKANHGMIETEKRILAGEGKDDAIQIEFINEKPIPKDE